MNRLPVEYQPDAPAPTKWPGISGRSAHPGGYSDLAGISRLSPDPVYQGAEDAGP